MTKEQFDNLEINDYIYYYSPDRNIIVKNKIASKCNNPFDITPMMYIIIDDCDRHANLINFNSIVFLTEKECLQYHIKNGYRKELKYRYGKKYVEYFI